jgi:hypothetical protein
MSEVVLQTRTEHSRSIEDGDRFRVLEFLKKVGLLIPVSDLETCHGRLGHNTDATKWEADPSFANGGNDSGNNNVYYQPILYTSDRDTAKEFARARGYFRIGQLFSKIFDDQVANYTPEERQAWLDRVNARRRESYNGLDLEAKKGYSGLLDDNGQLKPYTMDDLWEWQEARRLKEEISEAERTRLWGSVAKGHRTELHNIVTADTDAVVLNYSFVVDVLNAKDRKKYYEALKTLVIPTTEGSPISFDNRDQTLPFVDAVQQAKKPGLLTADDIAELATVAKIDEQVALQLASAYNTRLVVQSRPLTLVDSLLYSTDDFPTVHLRINDQVHEVPINLEYLRRFLREAHIVGIEQRINSTTLSRDITAVSFFDLDKITTDESLEIKRKSTWQRLGGMATALSQFDQGMIQSEQPLLHALTEVYAKPENLVAAAKQVDSYKAIFESDAGNWEGYTLEEHTETVLRNFDENYADWLPVELLAPMRLAILSHDLGKPIAAARGEKNKQMEYNLAYAKDFLSKVGVDDKIKGLLLAVIGKGSKLAFEIEVRGSGEPAEAAMKELATKTLKEFYGSESVTEEQITGFVEMCKILQVCDGGAYTSMAITRSAVQGRGRYRNAPSFNDSFGVYTGFNGRSLNS